MSFIQTIKHVLWDPRTAERIAQHRWGIDELKIPAKEKFENQSISNSSKKWLITAGAVAFLILSVFGIVEVISLLGVSLPFGLESVYNVINYPFVGSYLSGMALGGSTGVLFFAFLGLYSAQQSKSSEESLDSEETRPSQVNTPPEPTTLSSSTQSRYVQGELPSKVEAARIISAIIRCKPGDIAEGPVIHTTPPGEVRRGHYRIFSKDGYRKLIVKLEGNSLNYQGFLNEFEYSEAKIEACLKTLGYSPASKKK